MKKKVISTKSYSGKVSIDKKVIDEIHQISKKLGKNINPLKPGELALTGIGLIENMQESGETRINNSTITNNADNHISYEEIKANVLSSFIDARDKLKGISNCKKMYIYSSAHLVKRRTIVTPRKCQFILKILKKVFKRIDLDKEKYVIVPDERIYRIGNCLYCHPAIARKIKDLTTLICDSISYSDNNHIEGLMAKIYNEEDKWE